DVALFIGAACDPGTSRNATEVKAEHRADKALGPRRRCGAQDECDSEDEEQYSPLDKHYL
ncbi:MAG: hypothetical protein ABI024_03995, partial [Vicinamibacterales bacterium]